MIEILKSKRGEGYIDVVVVVLVAMMVIAMAVKVYPVFVVKSDLNTFANELARVAEIEGQIGSKPRTRKMNLGQVLALIQQ